MSHGKYLSLEEARQKNKQGKIQTFLWLHDSRSASALTR